MNSKLNHIDLLFALVNNTPCLPHHKSIIVKFHGSFQKINLFVCLFVFVALRPMSTAMVIAGRSVHLTTLFPGQA